MMGDDARTLREAWGHMSVRERYASHLEYARHALARIGVLVERHAKIQALSEVNRDDAEFDADMHHICGLLEDTRAYLELGNTVSKRITDRIPHSFFFDGDGVVHELGQVEARLRALSGNPTLDILDDGTVWGGDHWLDQAEIDALLEAYRNAAV